MDPAENPEWIIEVARQVADTEEWRPLPGDKRTLAACRGGVEERSKLAGSLKFRIRNVATGQTVSGSQTEPMEPPAV
jgi:hypothetical protein